MQADTSPRIDPTLQIGAENTTVEVNADTEPELKTDRADVSTVFDQQQVSSLPVGDQNFTNLQLFFPARNCSAGLTRPMKTPRDPSRFRSTARHLAERLLSWMAPITRIRSWASSSSILRWTRSQKQRSPRRTSTPNWARQFPRSLPRRPGQAPTPSTAAPMTSEQATPTTHAILIANRSVDRCRPQESFRRFNRRSDHQGQVLLLRQL